MKLRTTPAKSFSSTFSPAGKFYQKASRFAVERLDFLPSQKRYNLTISDERRFLWFRVAKVGTRSIFRAFEGAGVTLSVENAIFAHYAPSTYRDYFKFAFVRNPWERLVSAWHDKIIDRNHFNLPSDKHKELRDFSRFVDWVATLDICRCDVHLRLQSELIDLSNIDFLGRMERFDHDLQNVLTRLGVATPSVPKENTSSRSGDYRAPYTPELAGRVAQIYERDISIFNYAF